MPAGRYGVRRFAARGERPDCFEIYDRRSGECASFGMYRYECEQGARDMNRRERRERNPETAIQEVQEVLDGAS